MYKVIEQSEPLGLTPAELLVVEGVASGDTQAQAGEKHFISEETVGSHLHHIHTRTGWSGQEQIVLAAIASGEFGSYANATIQAKMFAELGTQPSELEQE